MKILITGGAGFIGSNCAMYFYNKGYEVVLVDNLSRPGVFKNLKKVLEACPNINFIKSDVQDTKNYRKELLDCDAVIHLAGQTAVTNSIKDPKTDMESNILGTFNLLEAISTTNPFISFIFSSTNKVYGDIETNSPVKESARVDLISPYGCSKGSADFYVQDYARMYGLKTVVFRQSCIYGKFQLGVEDQGWVAHFVSRALKKKHINIFGSGNQVRDLLDVNDLVLAYDMALENIEKIRGQVFNIGGGSENAYSLLDVVGMLDDHLGYKTKLVFENERPGDQKYFVSDNTRLFEMIGWKPTIKFKQGLYKLIEWIDYEF